MATLKELYEQQQSLTEEQAEKLYSLLPDCEVASTTTQDADEAQWVRERLLGIGGSDVGSICGVNKYSSARLTYLIKTGQYENDFSSEAKERMSWGHKLEPIVADEFMERTGQRVVIAPATFTHKKHKWARANVDRFIVDDEGKPIGVLECKTADRRLNQIWEDGEVPLSYIYQLTWYLFITGLKYGAFAALIGGNKFYYYEVFLNEELLKDEIFPKCDKFWNYNVKNLIEPELSGSEADSEYMKETYADAVKNAEITLSDLESDELAEKIFNAKKEIKKLEATIRESQNKIQEAMKENEIAYTMSHTVKWSPRSQVRVDADKLRSEYPEIFEQCQKTIRYRVFTVK